MKKEEKDGKRKEEEEWHEVNRGVPIQAVMVRVWRYHYVKQLETVVNSNQNSKEFSVMMFL